MLINFMADVLFHSGASAVPRDELPTGSAEDDTTYASSEVSAESREEGEDYSSIHGGSSSDIGEAESSPMTDLGNLFAKAEREFSQIESKFSRIERIRARNLKRLEQLRDEQAKAVELGVLLGQQAQELEVELNNSQTMLDDMQGHLTHFLGLLPPAVE